MFRSRPRTTEFPVKRTLSAPLSRPAPRSERLSGNNWSAALPRGNSEAMRAAFTASAASLDVVAIVVAGLAAATAYHHAFLDETIQTEVAFRFAALVAIMHATPNLVRGDYGFHHFLGRHGAALRTFEHWTLAFLAALAFVFVTKTSADISRGSAMLFFAGGWVAVLGAQSLMSAFARKAVASRDMFLRRIFLVGYEEEINAFCERCQPTAFASETDSGSHGGSAPKQKSRTRIQFDRIGKGSCAPGVKIVSAAVLRGPGTLHDDLKLAAAAARIFRPDDIVILTPWHNSMTIEACVDAFMRVPASIHMGPERVLDRYSDAHIAKIGSFSSLRLVRPPLNLIEVGMKRLLDLVGSSVALVLLAPLLLIVAIAVKIDSTGPVFFVQRRYGFNQVPFRIFKFRSLTTLDDHAGLRQVSRSDPRLTRVGRFIRRTNIDELPQLLNVLRGDMSLVGPRPHVMSHDHMFERSIALSARRHNVKPGITGWAQINGFRGEIDSDEQLRGRIEHDLYYIDNWSPWLDLRILLLTAFSRKSYDNAY